MTEPAKGDGVERAADVPKRVKKAEKDLGDATRFGDDEYRLEQLLDHTHLFFEGTPKFLVEQALRADGNAVYTLADAQSVVEQFTAPTPED